MKYLMLLLFALAVLSGFCQEKITISGYVKNADSKENVGFAKVVEVSSGIGATTNDYGFFSIELEKKDSVTLRISSYDYPTQLVSYSGEDDITVEVLIEEDNSIQDIEGVVIVGTKTEGEENVKNTEVSVIRLDPKQAKLVPTLGGESDVLKVAQLLPGINKGLEGGTDFFVRGGDGDQNLILVDEATVYNPGHLFGFFSVFNTDVIKDMTIYKGAFPGQYGGRLSSVTDIKMKEGDKTKFHATGGIGLLSSRLTLQGPIIKDKMSFMVSGRRTYIDKVVKAVGNNLPYFFYDLNGKVNYKINDKNHIYVSSYLGNDVLKYKDGEGSEENEIFSFGFALGNFTQTARWTHIFGNKLFSNLSLIHSRFKYDIRGEFGSNNVLIRSSIRDISGKYDFTYYKSDKSKIKFGAEVINHAFRPNVISTAGEISEFLESQKGDKLNTLESSIYGNYEHDFSTRLKFSGGLRITSSALKGKFYGALEPRANGTYILTEHTSVKLSYSRMTQYMHRVSNSSVALPTDLWYPVTQQVKPQKADQIASSYNLYFPKLKSSLIIEGYYKHMRNLTEYKEGSNTILNDNFEELLLQGNGWSSGAEFLFRKELGKLTGWVGYTLSWTKRKFDGLNGGKPYFAKYDRRHYLTVVGIYEITPRFTFSAVFEYATGARFTPIVGQYLQPNAGLTSVEINQVYAERNSYSMSPSHRLDVNFVFKSKPEKKFQTEWHLGAYNVYNRASPSQIKVVTDETTGQLKYTQPGIFGFIPSVGFNFKF